jgi:hypothetical protein
MTLSTNSATDQFSESTPLYELLQQNEEISSQLNADKIKQLTDPAGYLGLAGVMVDRVLHAG